MNEQPRIEVIDGELTAALTVAGRTVHINRQVLLDRDRAGGWTVSINRTDPQTLQRCEHGDLSVGCASATVTDPATGAFLAWLAEALANPSDPSEVFTAPGERGEDAA